MRQLSFLLHSFARRVCWSNACSATPTTSPSKPTIDRLPYVRLVNQMRNILTAMRRRTALPADVCAQALRRLWTVYRMRMENEQQLRLIYTVLKWVNGE